MGALLQLAVQLVEMNCGKCGGVYAITESYRSHKHTQGGGWHCPYCQVSWGYFDNNENARLKKELEAERARKQAALNRANEVEQNLAQALRREKRTKTRIAAGVCPCCTRTFKQLAAHMHRKHPDYKEPKK